MEGELVRGSDGYYCLFVYTTITYGDDELHKMFSKFGKVVNFKRSQSSNVGFVRYQDYEEAKLAVDSLKDHPNIKVRNAHEKHNGRSKGDNRGNFGERNDTGNRHDYAQSSNYKNNTDEHRHDIAHGRNAELRSPRERTEEVTDERFSMSSLKSVENNKQEMPALVHQEEFAKQIYIGNLPHTAMQHQIYTLCKSMKVLHVDIFRTSSNLTYAQVHVEGNSDVDVLVKELNGYEVDDKKLVVMSLDSILIEHEALKKSRQVGRGQK